MIQELLRSNAGSATKSTVVNPLLWLFGIGLAATSGAAYSGAPTWLLIVLASFCALDLLAFFYAYFRCLIKDPNLLRSEKFNLRKLEIESLQIGDSSTGLFERSQMVIASNETGQNTQSIEGA